MARSKKEIDRDDRFLIDQAIYNSDGVSESLLALSVKRKREAMRLWRGFVKSLDAIAPPRVEEPPDPARDELDRAKWGSI